MASTPNREVEPPQPSKRCLYLCLQVTRQGQASYAHVHEIIHGLRRRDWSLKLFEPSFPASASRLWRLWRFLTVQVRLLPLLIRTDVIYIRSHLAALPTAVLARLFGIPVVQEVNGSFLDYYVAHPFLRRFSWVINYLSRLNLKLASSIIVVTPQLRDWVHDEIGNKPVHVVPNGANTQLFCPQAKTLHTLPSKRVVFFGAMARWHGVQDMIAAVRRPDWPPGVDLVLVGEGAESEAIADAAEDCERIVHLGKIPYREVPGVVAGSLAGLVAVTDPAGRSATGLSPIKLFETLACGVPAIVTDFPFQAELVRQHDCGLVIPPQSPKALSAAVRRLADADGEREAMGERGRSAIVSLHSWDQRASDTSEILRSHVGARRQAA